MLGGASEAELAAYVAEHADQFDEHSDRLVVGNGCAQPWQVLISAGL
jgi:hypothetical protein